VTMRQESAQLADGSGRSVTFDNESDNFTDLAVNFNGGNSLQGALVFGKIQARILSGIFRAAGMHFRRFQWIEGIAYEVCRLRIPDFISLSCSLIRASTSPELASIIAPPREMLPSSSKKTFRTPSMLFMKSLFISTIY